eukprot:gnl/Hemi2/18066_TR5973_c0_g1_i1.p1 gnl/Hemi2/18066_TR5973_c0_g1~~gnl/Hemi2/18066_TR5973_c0_g1_i1.p1  ORF type:complete len:201 (-),score=101.85 gnl/Hemi2/18066_TR5973_c0_g1_i1:148-750(-)
MAAEAATAPATEKVKVEDVSEDAPAAAAAGAEAQAAAGAAGAGKHSRAEKKNRKAMQKLGMKPVSGVIRVVIRKSKTILFEIAQPDVYKSTASDTYVIFGEAKIEDLTQQALDQFKTKPEFAAAAQAAAAAVAQKQEKPAEGAAPAAAAADDAGDEDAGSLDPQDINLVMQQGNVTRGKAIKALKANNGDVINAIMELST